MEQKLKEKQLKQYFERKVDSKQKLNYLELKKIIDSNSNKVVMDQVIYEQVWDVSNIHNRVEHDGCEQQFRQESDYF